MNGRTFFRAQMYLIDFSLSSLKRRKGKNISLLVIYTLVVFFLASVLLFAGSLNKEAQIILLGAPELILQRQVAGRHALISDKYLQQIGTLRGISEKRGRLWGYFYDPAVKANYTLMVPVDATPADGEILIGATISRVRGLGIGDYFSLRSAAGKVFSFKVTSVLDHESELVNADLLLISEHDFRTFFGIADGEYTDIVLRVVNPREVTNIARKLTVKFPDTRPILRQEILRTYDAIFSWRQGMILVLLSGGIMAFVIFAWDKASGLSGEEKREIGILKAVGWETGDILRMKFWEGVLISLTAFLLGYLLAYLHIFYGSAILFAPVLKGWAILYPSFQPVPFIDFMQVATLFFFTVFPYSAATLIPCWRAAIIDPDMVMR